MTNIRPTPDSKTDAKDAPAAGFGEKPSLNLTFKVEKGADFFPGLAKLFKPKTA